MVKEEIGWNIKRLKENLTGLSVCWTKKVRKSFKRRVEYGESLKLNLNALAGSKRRPLRSWLN